MNEANNVSAQKKPARGRIVKAVILIGIGILIAFPLFSMSYYTMVRTSTPEFCASCHEIKPAVRAWHESTHFNNAAGVVVEPGHLDLGLVRLRPAVDKETHRQLTRHNLGQRPGKLHQRHGHPDQ